VIEDDEPEEDEGEPGVDDILAEGISLDLGDDDEDDDEEPAPPKKKSKAA
jgi:hypothetical protein